MKKMMKSKGMKRGGKTKAKGMAKGGMRGGRRMMMKKGGKARMMKKGGMAGLDAAERQVYKRGLAAYMSSGNRPKTSQHAWAMGRVNSAFGKNEASKIRAGKKKG